MSIKRITGIVLAIILVLALGIPAFAAGDGSITINDSLTDGTDSATRSYNAYKILNATLATNGTPVYSVPTEMVSFYQTYFSIAGLSTMTQAQIDAKVLEKIHALTNAQMELFAEAALQGAKAASIMPVSITGDTKTTVPFGYYVIEDLSSVGTVGRVSAVMVDTTTPDAEINLKADTPSIDKSIVKDGTPVVLVDASQGAIGDTVNYQIDGKVPDMTGFTKYYYIFTDTLSAGLDLDPDSIVVKVGTTALTAGLVDGSTGGYHVNYDSMTGELEIVFHDFIQYKTNAATPVGTAITITYSAVIDDDAVIGSSGNPNEAKLIYSNNPKTDVDGLPGEDDKPKDVIGVTPKTKTWTYTAGIKLCKVDEDGENALAGAVFTLEGTTLNRVLVTGDVFTLDAAGTYYKLLDGTYTETAPVPATEAKYESTTDLYLRTTETTVQDAGSSSYKAEGTTDENGHLVFDGLSAGTYTLTEITAPSGYSLLANPLTIVIGWTAPSNLSVADPQCTWTFTVNGTPSSTLDEIGRDVITIKNVPSSELPSTGGMGTTIFTIGGLILMAGAALVLVVRRKGVKSGK